MPYRVLPILLFVLSHHLIFGQNSLTFNEALANARNNNPILKSQKFSINISSSDIVTAGLRPNPIFNNQTLQLLNSKNSINGTGLLSGINRQVWYQLSKPMLLGNMRGKRVALAKQEMVTVSENYNELNRSISYETALKWLDAWLLKRSLVNFNDAKLNVDSLVFINTIRLKNQVITPIELIRTQLLSDQYTLQLKSINNQYQNEIRNLKYFTGIIDSTDINDNAEMVTIDLLLVKDSLFSIALTKRSDLAYAKSNIEASKKNIVVQKAAGLPYFEGGVIFNPQNLISYAGTYATLSIPVFSRNQGEREKAQFILKQSEAFYSAKEIQIRIEVQNAFNSFELHKKNLVEFQSIVKKAFQVLNTVKYSYLKGNTTLIDYLEAQRSYLETKSLLNEAIYNYRKSYIDVLNSTGLIMDLN